MESTPHHDKPDDWELVNDDGFVYRRKKRLDTSSSSATAPPPPDPAAERKHLRERKKRALLKLRDRYTSEIRHWELLSNTLKEMENTSKAQTQSIEEPHPTTSYDVPFFGSGEQQPESNSTRQRLVDDLLSQVEAQEAIIRDVSNLCDVAEALCSAQEERLKNQFLDLPVWEPSPNELMTVLCER